MDRQIRILLADGNEEFCGRLKQTLEEDGRFSVVGVAGDGVRACELMQSCHPDVLALDLMLPKMDGIAVLKKGAGAGERAAGTGDDRVYDRICRGDGGGAWRAVFYEQAVRLPGRGRPDPRDGVCWRKDTRAAQ